MEDRELTDCLREVFVALNEEARLAGPATLERCLYLISEESGVGWLLDTAQALRLSDVEQVRRHAGTFRDLVRSEAGRAGLRAEVARRQPELQRWRRQMVAHMRAWGASPGAMAFQCQKEAADAGEVYGMLSWQPGQEVKDE